MKRRTHRNWTPLKWQTSQKVSIRRRQAEGRPAVVAGVRKAPKFFYGQRQD